MTDETNIAEPSELGAAFVLAVGEFARSRIAPRARPFLVVCLEAGQPPRIRERVSLARELRDGGMTNAATIVARTKTNPREVLVWILADDATGLLKLAVERLPDEQPTARLPDDETLHELLDDLAP